MIHLVRNVNSIYICNLNDLSSLSKMFCPQCCYTAFSKKNHAHILFLILKYNLQLSFFILSHLACTCVLHNLFTAQVNSPYYVLIH